MGLHFHPPVSWLHTVVVGKAGDKIEGEPPKKRPSLGGSYPSTLHWLYGGHRGTRPLLNLKGGVSEGETW